VRFLWALREAAVSSSLTGSRHAWPGAASWAPQVRVLAHAAFMTHAGMSLVVEGVLFGRLLVMLPLFVDQGIITRLMAERRVGLEVPRDERNGSVGRYDVAATVMAAEEGTVVLTRNARAMQEVLWDTTKQEQYVDEKHR
jgi:UDP:flavonoid glycosyltransferase YjiC (YdhE family)